MTDYLLNMIINQFDMHHVKNDFEKQLDKCRKSNNVDELAEFIKNTHPDGVFKFGQKITYGTSS